MSLLKTLQSLVSGKKKRGAQPSILPSRWPRLCIEVLESRDLPSLTPSGLILASSGYDMPTFSWTSVAGTNHYVLDVIDHATGRASIAVANIGGSATSYHATAAQALTPGHSYTTELYAYSTNGQYSLITQTFSLAALAAPSNLTPSTTIPASAGYDEPTFSWNAVAGANHYYLKVVDDSTGLARIVAPDVTGTSYTATVAQALTPGHSFTTYVYAYSTNNQAFKLTTKMFTLAALTAPTNLTPNATISASSGYDQPTFTWSAVTGANHYYLKVVDNSTGLARIVAPDVSSTSYTTTPAQSLTPGHSFTTYVYAYSTNGQVFKLSTQKFALAALTAPTNLTPSDTIPTSSGYDRPTFTWSAVTGANHYYLKVVDNTTGLWRIVAPDVSGTSYTTTVAQALTPGHSFTTYVYAYSTNGQAFKLSTQKFTLAALTAPSLTSGPSGTIAASNGYDTPTFTWSSVSGANHYYLRLVDTTTNAAVITNTNVSTNSLTPTGPLTPGHSYTWYVAAEGANGQNALAISSQSFNLAALATPTQSGPSGTISATSPSFAWSNVSGANHYYLRVVDTTTSVAVVNNLNVSTNSFTTSTALTPGHSYTWAVAAVSNNGKNTLAFSSQSFTLATAALAAPSLISGPSGTINTTSPSFAWSNVSGASHYSLRLVDTTTNVALINDPIVTTTSFALSTPLTPGHAYTWYVAAKGDLGQSLFSSQTFNVTALAAPSLASGHSGTIAASSGYETPTFTWGAVPGANHYSLHVVDNNTGTLAIYVPSLNGTSYTTTAAQALMAGHSFTTYVYAYSTNSQTFSLSTQTFALAALVAPTNLTPSGIIPVASGYQMPTFTWSTVTGANHYYLRVVDNITGLAKIVVPNISGTSYTTTAGQALTPGHSYTTYVYAFGTNSQASSLGTQAFTLATAPTPTLDPPAPPTATLVAPATVNEGSVFTVGLTNPVDTSSAATAAGFHYAFALDGASLAGISYASASVSPSQSFTFTDGLSTHNITVRILANDGTYTDYTVDINVNYVPPTAIVGGPYSGTAGSAVAFTGSATDPSAPDTAAGFQFSWNFGDGTTSTLQSPSHTFATIGTYTVTLTVSDTDGGSSSVSTTATVAEIINFNSPGFSTTGPWYWDATNNNEYLANPGTGNAVATWQSGVAPGTYEVWTTWVAGGPRATNAPYTILDGSTAQAIVDVNQNFAPLGLQAGGFTWQELGVFSIQSGQLVVQLSNNANNVVVAQGIRIQPDNGAPVSPALAITGLPSSGHSPVETPVNLGCEVIAPGITGTLEYAWSVTKNGQLFATGNAASFTFTPDQSDVYQITLTVTTPAGGSATATATLTADPVAPTVSVASSFSGREDWAVDFSATGSDVSPEDAASLTYAWNFGDGTTGTGATPIHVYTSQGTYAVSITVTDENNLTASATTTATIANLGPAPSYIVTPYLNIPDFGYDPTIVSVQSGNWSNPATWSLDRVPAAGDIVDINSGTTVTYNVDDTTDAAPLNTVEVKAGATLTFSTAASTQMYAVNLMVLQGGELDLGTQANPIPSNITATVVWVNQLLNTAIDPEQYGNGLIVLGTFNTYGAAKTPFVTLAQNADAGNTVLQLASPATGWQVGDKLQLPDTRQLDSSDDEGNYTSEAESVTIQSISANGLTVTLTAPLQFNHIGAYDRTGALVYLPQVTDMTRNVSIHSQSATGTRGYALFTYRANVNINYTSFSGMGRTTDAEFLNSSYAQLFDNTTFDSNGNVTHVGTDEQNRNAITFLDLIGPSAAQANGYQFTFNGNVVTCPLTPMPFIWGINVVNSYYGLIQNDDVVNWAGSGVMVDGLSSYNTFNGNFVMRINGTGQRGSGDVGFAGDGFWFGNSNNYVTNNIVSDLIAAAGPYGYAYEFYAIAGSGEIGEGYVNIPAYQGADPSQPGQSEALDMNLIPILEFTNNEAYGAANIGLSYWWINYDPVNNLSPVANGGIIQNFVAWNLSQAGIYGYPSNNITIQNFADIGNALNLEAIGIEFSDYYTGNVVIKNVNLQNLWTGIMAPVNVSGPTTIENSYLADQIGIDVPALWTVDYYVNWFAPRDIVINNVQFVAPGNGGTFTAIDMDWFQPYQYESGGGGVNLIDLDQVYVYNYNGISGDNFQLYYTQQAASFVVPQTILNSDGTASVLGAPVSGLTNAQTWALYGIAIAGAVAPSDATTMSGIDGLVVQI